MFPAVRSVNKAKAKVLGLFVEIPNHYATELSQKCEEFINTLHEEQPDDLTSEDDTNKNGEDKEDSASNQKRFIHKSAKNTSKSNRNFFAQFCAAMAVIMAYFTAMFIIANTYISNIDIVSNELSTSAYNEALFTYTQNT